MRNPWIGMAVFFGLAVLLAAFAPLEKALGANARLVYFHGAWVWAAMLFFLASALCGAAGLLTRRPSVHAWSLSLGRTALCFWIAFLPMSLLVMQVNWNGLYLDEPRFRLPLNLAVVGLLLQVGLHLFRKPTFDSLGNLAFGLVFFLIMDSVQSVLHPESPIFGSNARGIQAYFGALLLLLVLGAWQLSRWWLSKTHYG